MLFDLLNRILHSKRDVTTNIGEDSVHPYILNRWISMYSPDMAVLINNTGNWLYNVFGDDHGKYFRFLSCFLPRVKNKRIFYIRKNKKNVDVDDQSDQNVDVLAHGLELSKREIKYLLEYERQHRPTNTN